MIVAGWGVRTYLWPDRKTSYHAHVRPAGYGGQPRASLLAAAAAVLLPCLAGVGWLGGSINRRHAKAKAAQRRQHPNTPRDANRKGQRRRSHEGVRGAGARVLAVARRLEGPADSWAAARSLFGRVGVQGGVAIAEEICLVYSRAAWPPRARTLSPPRPDHRAPLPPRRVIEQLALRRPRGGVVPIGASQCAGLLLGSCLCCVCAPV